MQNLEFGLTLTVLGMGGTLVILYLIGLVVNGMNKILLRGEKKGEGRG
jgi:Na+-transporting methylmalonyl-CoA/oxaloacetate decarboxylase gamma subunit